MLHHLSFAVTDLEASAFFYDRALAALGYTRVWTTRDAIGYGHADQEDKLAIKLSEAPVSLPETGFHVAFTARTQAAVQAFHAAALTCGGRDNGRPGLRPDYGPDYYAAFVIDPDGYHLEAVVPGHR